jgi:colanic acid/amylovoran biosynthesis glycosyltransferase
MDSAPLPNRQDGPPPRVAYLTNQYPSVSHTFIRREMRALEQRGYHISRYAVRPGTAIADPEDFEELKKTHHLLGGSLVALTLRALRSFFTNPHGALRALCLALAMASVSDRGMERHIAYWVEAACLAEMLEEERVDHVHVHFGTNAASVARLVKAFGGPGYSMTVHGPDEFDQAIGHSLGGKVEDSRFTVAISRYCASQLKRWVRYDQWNKIRVVHCTVNPEWFCDTPIHPDSKSIVYTGRLTAQKGLANLLEAFTPVAQADASRRLVLVGDGEMRAEIEAQIAARGLGEQVLITGWQTETQVRGHLANARALVLSSFAEGLPVVIMEALAMCRPVVATRIMGIPELVRDGVDGWLVTPGDTNALAAAMEAVFETPLDRLNAMGAAGQKQVRQMHTADTEVAHLDTLFRSYVKSGHA